MLAALGGLYAAGWRRLRRRSTALAPGWRLGCALLALAAVGVALAPPVDRAAHARFSAHMLQHLLLVTVAAPALLLADPYLRVLWALPRRPRRRLAAFLTSRTAARRLLAALTAMPVAWPASAAVLWLWHLPAAYEAALHRPLLHDAEHLSLFAAALVFWWPVVRPAPSPRRAAPAGLRVAYLVLGALQNAALGLAFVLLPAAVYPTYVGAAGAAPAREDQTWGGVLMWGVAGAVDMLAVLLVLYAALAEQERGTAPVSARRA